MTGSRDDVLEPSVYDLARESARVEGEATLVQGQMLLFVRDEPVKLRDRSYSFMFLPGNKHKDRGVLWLSPEMGPTLIWRFLEIPKVFQKHHEMSHIENFTRLSGRTRRGEAGRADVQGDMVKRHGWGCSKHWI